MFGAGTTSASHIFLLPGTAAIVAYAVDQHTENKNNQFPEGTASNTLSVNVGVTGLNGGTYTIYAGNSLIITASAPGDVSGFTFQNGGPGEAPILGALTVGPQGTTQTATYTWDELEAIGIDNVSAYMLPGISATYDDFSGGTSSYAFDASVTVLDTPPTGVLSNNGPVNQGGAPNGSGDLTNTSGAALAVSFSDVKDVAQGQNSGFTYSYSIISIDGVGTSIPLTTGFVSQSSFDFGTQYQQDFLLPGPVEVLGEVRDQAGGITEYFTTITVDAVPATFSATGNASVNEGTPYTLNLNATEPPGGQVETWTVNWGDGTTVQYVVPPPTTPNNNFASTTLQVSHVYETPSPIPNEAIGPNNPNGEDIQVTVTDLAGTHDVSGPTVVVNDVPPQLADVGIAPAGAAPGSAGPTTTIDESGFVDLSGLIVEPSTTTSLTLSVNWGDGTAANPDIVTYTLAAGTKNFDFAHAFAAPGNYSITAWVVDQYGEPNLPTPTNPPSPPEPSEASVTLTVNAVPPVLNSLTVQPPQIFEQNTVTVSGTYTDVGTVDTDVVKINWGDGTSTNPDISISGQPGSTIVLNPLNHTFTATHFYASPPPLGTRHLNSAYEIDAQVFAIYPADRQFRWHLAAEQSLSIPTRGERRAADHPDVRGGRVHGQTTHRRRWYPSTFTLTPNGTLVLTGTFTDAGPTDPPFTVSINWGQGTITTGTVTLRS